MALAMDIQDTVMLGADYYETDSEVASLLAEGRVPIGIGENTKIKYKYYLSFSTYISLYITLHYLITLFTFLCRDCIIDKNARIGKNVVIENSEVSFFK